MAEMDIDAVIRSMYASMSFEPGSLPDWQLQGELFAPGARLVRVNDDGVFEFDPRTFRANYEQMIANGLTSFWEGELARDTRELGDIAHVLSEYEMRTRRGGELVARAVKSIQLFRREERWWISAMLWRREGAGLRMDEAFRARFLR